jgi:hypothetical protein
MTFTIEEKLKCIERELVMRRNLYPRRVRTGQMKLGTADREIGIMDAIREDYQRAWARQLRGSSTAASNNQTSGTDSTSPNPPPATSTKS